MDHPLDRPIWTALTTRHAAFALSSGGTRRFHPDIGLFAAGPSPDAGGLAGLAALVRPQAVIYLQEEVELAPPEGFTALQTLETFQMVAHHMAAPPAAFAFEDLAAADGPEMLALVELTKPGPYAPRGYELGRFIGIRHEGRLIAMAGERLKTPGFTEISGVCTHPDHRGQGHAGRLMREIGRGIMARGETPCLHVRAANTGAIAFYRKLGFTTRSAPLLMVWQRD